MKRLCLIITTLTTGGAEIMLEKLVQKMDRRKFSPIVICLAGPGEIGYRIEGSGVTVYYFGMTAGKLNFLKIIKLVRLIRQIKPDVVHTWMYHADLIGGIAARLAGVKALAWGIRQSDLSVEKNKRSTLLIAKICASLSRIIPKKILSCSEHGIQTHVSTGYCAAKMNYIPNGFDLDSFRPCANARSSVRQEFCLDMNSPVVGLVARNDPQKNIAGFIEVASEVNASLPDVHFILAGPGLDGHNEALTDYVKKFGLENRIHLLGRRDDIPRLMASFDLLISTSFGEAFSNVLGEAMSCAVPCVATKAGDAELIIGEAGRLVEIGDMTSISKHIVDMLQISYEERLKLGLLARKKVLERYEIGVVTKLYEEFYENLLRDK